MYARFGAAFARGLSPKVVVPAVALGTGLVLLSPPITKVEASADAVAPPRWPWSHRQPWESFDHASIRRGYQVYKQVCSTCHSLSGIAYRNLVDQVLTEKEAKAEAADQEIEDGPDDEGEMFDRPRKLTDALPSPYPNDETARAVNNGALPPDLTLMVQARVGGEDYVYSLLTGYRAPPAGVVLGENLYWNPYFAGGQIAMTAPLSDGQVEYEDGTEATVSQMAKDVSTFLAWTAQPEHDDRKLTGWQVWALLLLMAGPAYYYKKLKWSALKTRQIKYLTKKK